MTARDDGKQPWPQGGGEMAARIRGHDWAATPLGAIEEWSGALKTAVDLMLDCVFPASLHWGPHCVQLYNDAYIPAIGARHPVALGASTLETFAELRDVLEPLMARVLAGETVRQEAQLYRYARDGAPEDTWFTLSHQPVREDGRVIAVLSIGVEVTEQVQAERRRDEVQAELERRAARQDFLLRLSDAIRAVSDPPRIMALAAEALGRELGLNRCGYGQAVDFRGNVIWVDGEWTDETVHSLEGPFRLDAFGPEMADQMRRGSTVRLDDVREDRRTRAAAGAYDAVGVRAMILAPLVKDDRFVAVLYAHQATPRRWVDEDAALVEIVAERTWSAVQHSRAEAALRSSQRRYRALIEAIDEGFCLLELVEGPAGEGVDYRHIAVNPAHARRSGIDGAIGRTIRDVLPTDEAEGWIEIYEGVRRTGQPARFRRRLETTGRLLELFVFPFGGADAAEIAILFQDVTEQVAADERLRLVVNELNHRVRNNLAIVQAMADQTFRGATDIQSAAHDLNDRLVALAQANDLLTDERAASVALEVLARQTLAAHTREPGRLRLSGSPVWLDPPMALSLSMALHELATNAVKYGAWSRPGGEVSLAWSVQYEAGAAPRLRLTWGERGGPPVSPPTRRGFGSRLIERALAAQLGGAARLTFAPQGLTCEIEAPLPTEGSAP